MKRFDILAFSPHPDDAELGCGGTLLLASDKGLRTAIADMSEGECSTRGTMLKRAREKEKASQCLGLTERFSLGLPDTEIGLDPIHRLPIIELVRSLQPRIVLSPYWVDRHPDHASAGCLVRGACYYSGLGTIGKGKPYRPTYLYYYMIHTPFDPSFIVDISSVWKRKKAILETYRTQFTGLDKTTVQTSLSHPNFLRYQKIRNAYYGSMISVNFGEPFFSPAPISFQTLPGLEGSQSSWERNLRYSPF